MDKELKLKVASLMKEAGENKELRKALAQLIVEYVDPGHITFDYIGQLLDTRALNPGDLLVKKLRKGVGRVWTHVPGTIPMKSEVVISERINYVLDYAITGITANVQELKQGEIGTVDSLRSEMIKKLRDFYMGKVFTALTSVWTSTNTPNNYADSGSTITKTALDNMMNTIIRLSGNVKAIAGTRDALLPITEFAGWAINPSASDPTGLLIQSIGEELMKTGWVGSYKGTPLVVIPLEYDDPESNTLLIPTNKILVIGDKAGEFITYGGVESQEYTQDNIVPPQWNLNIWQSYGFIIDYAQRLGVIKVG